MKIPLNLPTVASLCVNLAMLVAIYRLNATVSQIGQYTLPPRIETKVVDGKEPFLETFTVLRVQDGRWGGRMIAANFANTVRGQGYVVQMNNRYLMMYSPHLQDLKPGAQIEAWFVYANVSDDVAEGKLEFITPIELIKRTDPSA